MLILQFLVDVATCGCRRHIGDSDRSKGSVTANELWTPISNTERVLSNGTVHSARTSVDEVLLIYGGNWQTPVWAVPPLEYTCSVEDAENARHEIARYENARNTIVWNTACCIFLSTAEQECMSRQKRAPDFAADWRCPICRSEITMVLRLY